MTEPKDRVMIDIETLGLEPPAAILSIGAVKFDTDGLGEERGWNIDLESCQDAGLEIDASTLEWWLSQDDNVQYVLTGGMILQEALKNLSAFYGNAREVWAFSPSFDCRHLQAAYDAVGIVSPWDYRDTRDCRTLASLSVWPDMDQEGNNHDALDDARNQARQTVGALRAID